MNLTSHGFVSYHLTDRLVKSLFRICLYRQIIIDVKHHFSTFNSAVTTEKRISL